MMHARPSITHAYLISHLREPGNRGNRIGKERREVKWRKKGKRRKQGKRMGHYQSLAGEICS